VSSTWLLPWTFLRAWARYGEGAVDGEVVGPDDGRVSPDERLERDALRRREGEVDPDPAVRVLAGGHPARHPVPRDVAGEELAEALALDGAGEAQGLGAPALPR
jgi:hypothetical protein